MFFWWDLYLDINKSNNGLLMISSRFFNQLNQPVIPAYDYIIKKNDKYLVGGWIILLITKICKIFN
jgi:hypothetical protein